MIDLQQRANRAGLVMKSSYLLILLALTLSTWVWVPEGREPSLTINLFRVLPLLIFVTAVFSAQLRSLAWLCFVCLGYFVLAVTTSMSARAMWINHLELILIVTLFCSCTLFIRWQARAWNARRDAASRSEQTHEEHVHGE